MAHTHKIIDEDKNFVIDPINRIITNNSDKVKVVQFDHNSERFTFQCPRTIEGHDMSQSTSVRVQYINIDKKTRKTNIGVYEVDDLKVSPDDSDTVIFSWLISRNATELTGVLGFLIEFMCIEDDNTISYAWHTDIYKYITVSNGMDNGEVIEEKYPDILEKWKDKILAEIPNAYPHPIVKIENLDEANMVILRNLDSGIYVLHGFFKPYEGSSNAITFDSDTLVSITKEASESHVQIFYPTNNRVQYANITDTSYEKNDIYLSNLADSVAKIGDLNNLTTEAKEKLVTAINEVFVYNHNIVNGGKNINSLRTTGAASEDDTYSVGAFAFAEGNGTKAAGALSHAEGLQTVTTVEATASHAEGCNTTASKDYAHAEGGYCEASGPCAHAEGDATIASQHAAHAEGNLTKAAAHASHAEGDTTIASGVASHAEGNKTKTLGKYCHAEGNETVAGNEKDDAVESAHAEGNNTTASGSNSHAEGSSTTASETSSHAEGHYTWATGEYSHAEGIRTGASGGSAHAEGSYTTASGGSAHAEGNGTVASGSNSHVQGKNNVADPNLAHIVGNGTDSVHRSNAHTLDWSGNAWFAGDVFVGSKDGKNKDSGSQRLAKIREVPSFLKNSALSNAVRMVSAAEEKKDEYAMGPMSFAVGNNTKASGNFSFAEGSATISSSENAHAEGNNTTAGGSNSHAEGSSTQALGANSHAEGEMALSDKTCSHAEGLFAWANGNYAHAEGNRSIARGEASHAEGCNAIASGDASHVQGKFNVADPNLAHIVGNGTSEANRSNAHTLDWSGNVWFAGDVYIGSTSGTNKDDGSKKLATEEYVSNAVSTGAPFTFTINRTENASDGTYTYSADKTFAEILEAAQTRTVIAKDYAGNYYDLTFAPESTDTALLFQLRVTDIVTNQYAKKVHYTINSDNTIICDEFSINSLPVITTADVGKVLSVDDSATPVWKTLDDNKVAVDGTTIKFNDQGQLTLALSNANGVSF